VPESASAPQPTLEELSARVAALELERKTVGRERDEYKRLYVALMEQYRKLEAGLTRHQRERFEAGSKEQLVLSLMSMMAPGQSALPEKETEIAAHTRVAPTGRRPLPESLPRIEIEVTPPDVRRLGQAFERIGEDVTETVERRPASVVVVRTVRPKYVPKPDAAPDLPKVLQAPAPQLPIPRGLAGPGMLAETIVKRWEDHQPLHRMERSYGRDGLPLARSTICGWHFDVAELCKGLVREMWFDALKCSFLCIDATGVLVQALEKCRSAHFFVVVAPERHVLFGYSKKHDSAAVKKLIGEYKGTLVADAHAVYDFLYKKGDVLEAACWAHNRRYWFKSLDSDGARADHGLTLIGKLFELEREWAAAPPPEKLRLRQQHSKPIVESFFAWCDVEALKVLDETPISKAIGYARNQREALCRFLSDGRLPIHNNWSENALRREALGRRNWLFVGTDEGGEVNATLVTLLASCKLHGIEPLGYLRDLLCLLPTWPKDRLLELSPLKWRATLAKPEVQSALEANVFRQVSLGKLTATTQPAAPAPNRATSGAEPTTQLSAPTSTTAPR
jgi:transposase